MRWPPRREFLLALAGAALFSTPGGLRGTRLEPATVSAREWATVGRIVSRRVDGRTIVLVPVSGPVRPRLSEPFRVGSRWRLYLTLEGARIGINARPRKGEGVLSVSLEESGSDVRIAIDVKDLTTYGAKPAEEGILVWIEDEATAAHDAAEQARALPIIGDGPRLASEPAPPPPPEPEGHGWLRLIVLLAAAAGLGVGLRWLRSRETPPRWLDTAATRGRALLEAFRSKVPGRSTETDGTRGMDAPAPEEEPEVNEFRKTG
ncbi:MAG: hypothetical protein PVH00_07815 [Gemmatimonadota bacterium]|jgi:hypothetical protein